MSLVVIVHRLVKVREDAGDRFAARVWSPALRLLMRLPSVDPTALRTPQICPHGGGGQHVKLRQVVTKPVRDTKLAVVEARRSGCVRCGRTFRVYPPGVSHAQTSTRLRGLGVLLYLLGLSDGAVALTLEALGHPLSKVAVYDAVQAAGAKVPGLRRDAVRLPAGQALVAALGADLTSVTGQGEWLMVGVSVDALGGAALTVDVLDSGETADLVAWLEQIAAAIPHQNRGRQPKHTLTAEVRARVVALSRTVYPDTNDSHFRDLVAEREGIVLSRSAVARLRRAAGQTESSSGGSPANPMIRR